MPQTVTDRPHGRPLSWLRLRQGPKPIAPLPSRRFTPRVILGLIRDISLLGGQFLAALLTRQEMSVDWHMRVRRAKVNRSVENRREIAL
jgi:hypothetical protein